MGVLFGWSLRFFFKSLTEGKLGACKGSGEGKLVGLVIWYTNGKPLDIDFCWCDNVRSCKMPGIILESSEKSNECGILLPSLVDADG